MPDSISHKHASADVIDRAVRLYQRGLTIRQVGLEVGYHRKTVSIWLSKSGVTRKLRGDYYVRDEAFFDQNIAPDTFGGCWLWTGPLDHNGYGRMWLWNARTLAHRASWMIHRGPIADGLFVCHTCDIRCCVNPAHLWLGTHLDNMRDMQRKGRKHCESPLPILNKEQARAIRADPRTHRVIAADYGVSDAAIGKIKRGETWRHA